MAPTDSALAITRASCSWRSTWSAGAHRARRARRRRAPGRRRSAPRRSAGSGRPCASARSVMPGVSAATSTWVSPVAGAAGDEQVARPGRRTRPGAWCRSARARRRRPGSRGRCRRGRRAAGARRSTSEAIDVPASRPASSTSACRVGRLVAQGARPRCWSAPAGPGAAWRAELVGDQREVDEPVAADRAAAVGLVRPAGRSSPARRPGASSRRRSRADRRGGGGARSAAHARSGTRGGLAEELLIGAQVQQHGRLRSRASDRPRRSVTVLTCPGSGTRPRERLGLEVLVEPGSPVLPPDAAVLVPAERHVGAVAEPPLTLMVPARTRRATAMARSSDAE